MTLDDAATGASPVLRNPQAGQAPRLVGRAPETARPAAPAAGADPVAAALARLAPGPSQVETPTAVDDAALQRAREEGRQAGLQEGREQALREQAHAGFEEGDRKSVV